MGSCSCTAGLGVLDFTDDLVLPAPAQTELKITGYPEGWWLNYVTWSKDSRQLAFSVRCPGVHLCPAYVLCSSK